MRGADATLPSPPRPYLLPVDLGLRSAVVAARTVAAGLAALAIAYWLDLQDPQWAILTVFLVTQQTAGAVAAKSLFRIIGTLAGALFGLAALALYAEAAVPFIGLMVLWLGGCIYGSMRVRNFASYGFLLAGYSALLVGFEGIADPTGAWTIAVDRSTEIIVGILCAMAASSLVAPVYAGEALRGALAATFTGLAGYAAATLRPDTGAEAFASLRRRMIGDVVTFDALRSYTLFEAPEVRPDDAALRRVGRDFLGVLAVARSLFVRLDDFRRTGAGPVLDRVAPVLAEVADGLGRIAADRTAASDPRRVRHALLGLRKSLGDACGELEALAGTASTDTLANGLLVLRRTGDMLHGLSMVMVADAATFRAGVHAPRARPHTYLPALDRTEAVLQGVRAGAALLVVALFWFATAWSAGFAAISGLAVMLFIFVNQDDPRRVGWPYLGVVAGAVVAAYLMTAFVLPRLEGYGELAICLAIVLFPAALAMTVPKYTVLGAGFGAFFASEIGTGNVFTPAPELFVNNGLGLLGGMAACIAAATVLLPVDPRGTRRRAWRAIVSALPAAARGERPEREVAAAIFAVLAGLLPRLDLGRPGEEDILRGALGAASMALELGRLRRQATEPRLPPEARAALATGLDRLAATFEALAEPGADRPARLAEAVAAARTLHEALLAITLVPGSPEAAMVVRTIASLRFVADRFDSDRAFLLRTFDH